LEKYEEFEKRVGKGNKSLPSEDSSFRVEHDNDGKTIFLLVVKGVIAFERYGNVEAKEAEEIVKRQLEGKFKETPAGGNGVRRWETEDRLYYAVYEEPKKDLIVTSRKEMEAFAQPSK